MTQKYIKDTDWNAFAEWFETFYQEPFGTSQLNEVKEFVKKIIEEDQPVQINLKKLFHKIIKSRISYFEGKFHKYEAIQLSNALCTLKELIPPINYEVNQPEDLLTSPIRRSKDQPVQNEQSEDVFSKNDIDFAYCTGIWNTGGIDVLSKELDRLKQLNVKPYQIFGRHETLSTISKMETNQPTTEENKVRTAEEMLIGCEHDGSFIPVSEVKRLMEEFRKQGLPTDEEQQ